MERLEITAKNYVAEELAIHMARYSFVKKLVKGKKILDLACGEGYGSFLMKKWGGESTTVIGVDISKEAIEKAKTNFSLESSITFISCNAENLPFNSEQFDLIVSFETIEHVEHPQKFLSEIKRVLKKDGALVLSCPNDYYYEKHYVNFNYQYHLAKYSFNDFKNILQKCGITVSSFYFGLKIDGFVNLNQKKLEEKTTTNYLEAISGSNTGIIESILIPKNINFCYEDALYYIAVCNCNLPLIETPVIYPCIAQYDKTIFINYQNILNDNEDKNNILDKTKRKLKLEEEKNRLLFEQSTKIYNELLSIKSSKLFKLLSTYWKAKDFFKKN